MSYEESYGIIKEWLDTCNSIERFDNYENFVNYRIHSALKNAIDKGIGTNEPRKDKNRQQV